MTPSASSVVARAGIGTSLLPQVSRVQEARGLAPWIQTLEDITDWVGDADRVHWEIACNPGKIGQIGRPESLCQTLQRLRA